MGRFFRIVATRNKMALYSTRSYIENDSTVSQQKLLSRWQNKYFQLIFTESQN